MIPTEPNLKQIYSGLKSKLKKYEENGYQLFKIQWETPNEFSDWYKEQYNTQKHKCAYCGTDQDNIRKVIDNRILTSKRFDLGRGRRGNNLEVERKEPNENYDKTNCVLICYFCNNAKSDVFSKKEFLPIAKEIGKVLKKNIEGIDKIKKGIKDAKWIFAKTYAKTAPHEYIIKNQNLELFNAIANLIDTKGYTKDFTLSGHTETNKYFDIDGYRYWHYDVVLNRTDKKTKWKM